MFLVNVLHKWQRLSLKSRVSEEPKWPIDRTPDPSSAQGRSLCNEL